MDFVAAVLYILTFLVQYTAGVLGARPAPLSRCTLLRRSSFVSVCVDACGRYFHVISFHWPHRLVSSLQLERGLGNRQTRDADWPASQGLQVVLEREVASQSANVSPRTVCAYWPPKPEGRGHRRASPQNWSMFVRNYSQNIIVCDFLVVVTNQFRTLYVFSSWRLVRCASCIETSPRIQRQSGPYNSFAKRFRAIIRTVS